MKRIFSILSLLLAVVTLLAISPSVRSDEPVVGVQIGQMAPDFDLPVVGGEEGQRLKLYDVVAENDATLIFFFLAAS